MRFATSLVSVFCLFSACSTLTGNPTHVGEEATSDDTDETSKTDEEGSTSTDSAEQDSGPSGVTSPGDPSSVDAGDGMPPETDPTEPNTTADMTVDTTDPDTDTTDPDDTDPEETTNPDETAPDVTDAPPPPPPAEGSVPLVLGVGTGFETMLSCDGGQSWINGRAVPGGMCVDDGDCSHDPGRAMGLTYSNGWFIVPYGNDPEREQQVRRTRDGVNWEQVLDRGANGAAAGNGRVVLASNPPTYSDDDGETWTTGDSFESTPPALNTRAITYIPYDGGRFLMYLESNAMDMVVSRDGETFISTGQFPQNCRVSDMTYGGGVVIIANHAQQTLCRSDDGGETWTTSQLTPAGGGDPVIVPGIFWTGTEFIAFGAGSSFSSPDGLDWAPVTVTSPTFIVGGHTRTDEGTFVGEGNSNGILTSPDALTWTLVSGDYMGYLDFFAAGFGSPTACE